MMRATALSLTILLITLMTGCRHNAAIPPVAVTDTIYSPVHASGFVILDTPHGLLLQTLRPWQGDKSSPTQLLIADGETLPEGFAGQAINGPARRIALMSSTHLAMLDALGLTFLAVAVSGKRYITNPAAAELPDVGHDSFTDYEALVGARPDLVLLYGVDGPSANEGKLRELGIPFAYVGDYTEMTPLGKAEWVVAIGAITGHLDRAKEIFAEIPMRYDAVKVNEEDGSRPGVMLNLPYGDTWFMPGGDSYLARLIADAGGCYPLAGEGGGDTRAVSEEQALQMALSSDVWVIPGNGYSIDYVRSQVPRMAAVPPMANRRVYDAGRRATAGGGNDFFESGIMHPDLILRDLRMIFYPSEAVDSLFTYFRPLE